MEIHAGNTAKLVIDDLRASVGCGGPAGGLGGRGTGWEGNSRETWARLEGKAGGMAWG